MALQDQIKTAKAEGYSSQEIIQFLAQSNPQVAEAVKEGYAPDEIVNFISQTAPTAPQSPVNSAISGALRNLLPSMSDLNAPMTASKKLGTMVEAGGAGIGDVDASLIPAASNAALGTNFNVPPISGQVEQAGQDVNAVENGQPPTSTAGTVGKDVGSFFTPNQIALQGLGGVAAPIVANSVGNAASSAVQPILTGLTQGVQDLPFGDFLSKMIPATIRKSPEAYAALANSPEAVVNAQPMADVAQDTGSFLKNVAKQGQASASAAKDALSDDTVVKGAGDIAQNTLGKLTSDKSASQLATDTLADITKSIQKDPSEANIGDAIDKLDDLVKYNSQSAPDWSNNLRNARQQLSTMLKSQNPAYKAGMEASAATRLPLKTLSTNLGVRNGQPADYTIGALDKLNNPDALATQNALKALPGGTQLAGNAANASARDALQNSLLGKLALWLTPRANGAVQGATQALPAVGNAAAQTYQGLTQ